MAEKCSLKWTVDDIEIASQPLEEYC